MDALSILKGQGINKNIQRDFMTVFKALHNEIQGHCDDHVMGIQLRKFAAWFSTGYPGASLFRKNLFQTKDNNDLMSIATEFFETIKEFQQEDTSAEPFLMGGHG